MISKTNNTNDELSILFHPLNIANAGTYTCSVIVTPQNSDFVNGTTASISQNIEVDQGKYITCMFDVR